MSWLRKNAEVVEAVAALLTQFRRLECSAGVHF
mgnify:CR=1 FL=1